MPSSVMPYPRNGSLKLSRSGQLLFLQMGWCQMGGFQGQGEVWGSTEATCEMALQTETEIPV